MSAVNETATPPTVEKPSRVSRSLVVFGYEVRSGSTAPPERRSTRSPVPVVGSARV
ncbi:MAG: hypothetical protein IPJ34_23880 [Myxococcales bacterium]|nr:hypothetical protein [Myxococcales bacterium]